MFNGHVSCVYASTIVPLYILQIYLFTNTIVHLYIFVDLSIYKSTQFPMYVFVDISIHNTIANVYVL